MTIGSHSMIVTTWDIKHFKVLYLIMARLVMETRLRVLYDTHAKGPSSPITGLVVGKMNNLSLMVEVLETAKSMGIDQVKNICRVEPTLDERADLFMRVEYADTKDRHNSVLFRFKDSGPSYFHLVKKVLFQESPREVRDFYDDKFLSGLTRGNCCIDFETDEDRFLHQDEVA